MAPTTGREPSTTPELSVILLTKDEEVNVSDAVTSLLEQEDAALEVIVVDSASEDDTVPVARSFEEEDARVRVLASQKNLTVGEARNLGLREARAPAVAFMSADAFATSGWARAAVDALRDADVVYGRQEHAPDRLTVAAVVRGLRYHHFRRDAGRAPAAFASNVNAAIRRDVFERVRYVDDGPASALDDILFTKEAVALGARVAYRRDMLVKHKDATTLRMEVVKNRREGYGWGLLAPRLGVHGAVLAWGIALPAAAAVAVAAPGAWPWALPVLVAYAPALRRVLRAGGAYVTRAPVALAGALLVSPLIDLTFLTAYLRGLRRRRDLSGVVRGPQGV